MLWIPQKGALKVVTNMGVVGSTTPGASVTTGAAAATKGAPVELLSAATVAFDVFWLTIVAHGYAVNAGRSEGAMDILAGAATEDVLIPNLLFGNCGTWATGRHKWWDFPVYIPAGTRISVQAAGQRTATAFRVGIYAYGGVSCPPWRVASKVVTYGVSVPGGTALTPGTSGAQGSFTQITAATSEAHWGIVPSLQAGNDTGLAANALAMTVGVGAATEEQVGGPYSWTTETAETLMGPTPSFPMMEDIPSGTRLAARASASGSTADALEVALHCLS